MLTLQSLGEARVPAGSLWWDPPAHMEAGDRSGTRCACVISHSAVLSQDL